MTYIFKFSLIYKDNHYTTNAILEQNFFDIGVQPGQAGSLLGQHSMMFLSHTVTESLQNEPELTE